MTFLNPIAFIGLLAAGIPIVLHIFNLRKLKTIDFSTLSFLKELQKTKIRRLKLRQLLLLFLRILFVILFVVAFSRPTLKGSLPGNLAGTAKTTAVLLFDDSQSMTASDEQGELLQQAKNAAIAVLNILKEGDEVYLVKLSDVPRDGLSEIPSAQRNFPALRNTILEIKPSWIHRSIEDALRFTARLLAASNNFNKEVYLISDFQSGSLESKTKIPKSGEKLFIPAQFFIVPLGTRELQNVSIGSIEIPSTIFEVNKPFTVKAKMTNHGPSHVQNHVLSVYQNGSRVAQKGIDIHAGQSVETEFTLVPKQSGFFEGKIELEDDDLEFDNVRYFTVHIPEELHVLLIGSTSDFTYLSMTLAARPTDSSASLKISRIPSDRLSSFPLNNTDVVVFSNLSYLTHDQSLALKTYLQHGGGMLFFPGTNTSREAFNDILAAPFGISTINDPDDHRASPSAGSFIEFDKVDLRHPLFAGMFAEAETKRDAGTARRQRILESPRIKKSLHYIPTPKSRSIITLTNGYPFLIEEQIGDGHLLLFSVPADTGWSDLPMKGVFVPLVHRSLAYLAQRSVLNRSLLVGEGTTIHFRTAVLPELTITKPGNQVILVNPQQIAAEKSIRFSDNDLPGLYTVASAHSIVDKFAVNVDPDESNTSPSDKKHRDAMVRRIGIADNSIHTITQPQEVQRIITESRLGSELWKQFLIAALIIAMIEMFVARDSKRSRPSVTTQLK